MLDNNNKNNILDLYSAFLGIQRCYDVIQVSAILTYTVPSHTRSSSNNSTWFTAKLKQLLLRCVFNTIIPTLLQAKLSLLGAPETT